MLRPTLAVTLLFLSAIAHAQDPGGSIDGQIQGHTYISPTGVFKVSIPVLPELGGNVTDTPNVVTFQDDFSTHVSIAAFPQDATQHWEMTTRGQKDYLTYFFTNFVLPDFKQAFEGTQVESAKFVPSLFDGSLLVSILLPGGSMFADRIFQFVENAPPPVAKRGNLLFVKNGHIFVLSIELAEKVIEGTAFKKTVEEEDEILRQRLLDVAGKMQFAKAPAASTGPTVPPGIAAPKK